MSDSQSSSFMLCSATEFSGKLKLRQEAVDCNIDRNNNFAMPRAKKRGPYKKRRFTREIKATPRGWPKVAEWRDYMDWTQEELADRAGLSVGTISGLECQEVGFGRETLEKLAKAFGITIGILFDANPNEDPELWQLWSDAAPPQREQIIAYTQGLLNRKQ